MITEIQIDRSRILKGVRVPVRERFSVVVGPNGSGKTTLLRSIAPIFSSVIYRGDLQGAVLFTFIDPANDSMKTFRIEPPVDETGFFLNPQKKPIGYDEIKKIRRGVNTRVLSFSARDTAQISYNESEKPLLGDSGENLASIISWYLKTARQQLVEEITTALRILVPQVQRIWVSNAKLERDETEIISAGGTQYPVTRKKSYWGDLLMFDTIAKKGIPASEMSEGTLLATALLTLLHGENPPNLLLLDDIDKGLHPRAINSLVEILRGLMAQRPELQIIATTHSPYLLDQIPVEAVICMHVGDDGFAKAKLLSEHPEYENWKDTMTAGEFWSVMGEAWVTQDVKAAAT